MPTPTFTTPPPAPQRSAPSTFSTLADTFIAYFATLVTELTTFIGWVNTVIAAFTLNSTTATSTTSLTVGTGAQSLTVDISKSFMPGMSVKIARTASPSNWMHGDVTSYNSGTGALVVNVTAILGSGTFTDWTITLSAPGITFASAAEELAGYETSKASSPSLSREMIINLKPVINVAVNKLDIFTKSGGAVPSASNPIKVMIPDGNGYTQRTRAAAYLSGTSQFIMANAANYWSKGSLDGEIKTAYIYAIWDGTGIVWALSGYSGFTRVPASTTATDDDFFLLEEGSTYTKAVTEYCVCVGKIRYQYDTADTPDHTIQATVLDAPQVVWNPKSDYGGFKTLASAVSSASDIAEYSAVSVVVKQSGYYSIIAHARGYAASAPWTLSIFIRVGSATYGSAVQKADGMFTGISGYGGTPCSISTNASVYLNAGETIHLGISLSGGSTKVINGDSDSAGTTGFLFTRIS